jgi:cytidylate kinase
MNDDVIVRLDRALSPLGPAHHAVFIETDGVDPDEVQASILVVIESSRDSS